MFKKIIALSALASGCCLFGQTLSSFPTAFTVRNDTTSGTTLNKLAKLTASSQAITSTTADLAGLLGIVVQGAGKTGNAGIAQIGIARCVFDGATVARDYVQASTTVAGDCHDAGSVYPGSTLIQVIGKVLSTNSVGGSYDVDTTPEVRGISQSATAIQGNAVATGTASLDNQAYLFNFTRFRFELVQLGTAAFQDASAFALSGGAGTGTVTHNASPLTAGQLIFGNGSSDIEPGNLSGDISTAGTNATTLATVNGSPGSCGDSTHVCQFSANAKGLITAETPVAITGLAGGVITALTGDVAASGSGSVAAVLAIVNSTPGPCGDATHVCQVTTDGKGRTTAEASVPITVGGTGTVTHVPGALTQGQLMVGNGGADSTVGNLSGDVSTTGTTATTLAAVNGSPGTCGDASHVCQALTNGKGLVTAQSAVPIAITPAQVTGLNLSNIAAGAAGTGTFDFSGSTAVNLPSGASPTPTVGGDIRFDATQQATVSGGNGTLTGSFPRLIYWAHPASDAICDHGGDATVTLQFGAACNNLAGSDGIFFGSFATQPSIPANFMHQDKMLRVRYDLVMYTTTLNTGLVFSLKLSWGSAQIYTNSGAQISGSLVGASFLVDCLITAHSGPGTSASMSSSCSPEVPGYAVSSMSNKTTGIPVVNTSAPEPLKFAVDWAATGILSGTYTSGITATGTVGQTCNLGTFNNGNSGGTATVALTGTNTIAGSTPLVITNTGGNSTSAATSATASNGTATCSGTATVATVLGGTQGVAVQLRGVTVEELN